MNINKELIKLISENEELEVKFNISGDLYEDDSSCFIGEINAFKVGEYIEYGDRVYDDWEDITDILYEELQEEYEHLSNREFDKLVIEKTKEFPSKEVIWVYVGV